MDAERPTKVAKLMGSVAQTRDARSQHGSALENVSDKGARELMLTAVAQNGNSCSMRQQS